MRAVLVLAFLPSASTARGDALTLPYLDKDFGCTPSADADRYLKDFKVDLSTFQGREFCNPAVDTKLLLDDLTLIEKSKFSADAAHPFVQSIVPKDNYYGWARDQTHGVRRAHDDPSATAYNRFGSFTMQDGWAASSSLGRVGTLIHEARHTRGYPHTPCTTGPYAGSEALACDGSLAEKGANAVEMEYYARVVLESQNLNPVYKSMARLMAIGRTNFIFNVKPMQVREALLAKAEGKVTLVGGAHTLDRPIPALDSSYRLKRTSSGAALVNGINSYALDLYEEASSTIAKNDDYSYFKIFKIHGDELPENPADSEEVDIGNKRFFVSLSDRGNLFSYNFPEGAWFSPVAAPAGAKAVVPLTPSGQRGLFVVTDAGVMVPFNFVMQSFDPALSEKWPAAAAAFAMAGDRVVALENGKILDAATKAPLAGFSGVYTDLVNVPLYDAFDVAP